MSELKKTSLAQFLKENQSLIEILGVFIAISAFFLENKSPLGLIIGFAFSVLSIFIWLEIQNKMIDIPFKTENLFWFDQLLFISLVVAFINLLADKRFQEISPPALGIIMASIALFFTRKIKIIERNSILRAIIFCLVMLISISISNKFIYFLLKIPPS